MYFMKEDTDFSSLSLTGRVGGGAAVQDGIERQTLIIMRDVCQV